MSMTLLVTLSAVAAGSYEFEKKLVTDIHNVNEKCPDNGVGSQICTGCGAPTVVFTETPTTAKSDSDMKFIDVPCTPLSTGSGENLYINASNGVAYLYTNPCTKGAAATYDFTKQACDPIDSSQRFFGTTKSAKTLTFKWTDGEVFGPSSVAGNLCGPSDCQGRAKGTSTNCALAGSISCGRKIRIKQITVDFVNPCFDATTTYNPDSSSSFRLGATSLMAYLMTIGF